MPGFLMKTFARQLGGPSGPLGHVVARMLNKVNVPAIRAAIEALELTGKETVADIGFGGGAGLDLLLDATSDGGRVHGVEPSASMVSRAARQHREAVAVGRLELHEAGMEALPFADGALDGWITLNTLYFIRDLEPALRELARATGAEGRGVVGVADPDFMRTRLPFTKHGFVIRPVDDLVVALHAAGFVVDRRTVTSPGSDGPPPYHLLLCRPV